VNELEELEELGPVKGLNLDLSIIELKQNQHKIFSQQLLNILDI
jgi:hypothetical protein